MNLFDIVRRQFPPIPWADGEKIPWNDPGFSERMLVRHLSQDHDWASRRFQVIEAQMDFLESILPCRPARIMDLACGPGLYTHSLRLRGHTCTGVDFAPASIAHATQRAIEDKLTIEYILSDIRRYSSAASFDCLLFTFGEFNVFQKKDARQILHNAFSMLTDNGIMVLEAHKLSAVKEWGQSPESWQAYESGIFSATPHLCLQENAWDESSLSSATRYYIIDAQSGETRIYGSSMQGYSNNDYLSMFSETGFSKIDNEQRWLAGPEFTDKLQLFICQK